MRTCLLVVASALVITVACSSARSTSGAASSANAKTLRIATTVAPITSIVANIGGDKVVIDGIVPEGTNSHTFEPQPSVAKILSNADVIFANGLKLEEPTENLARANKKAGSEIVELAPQTITEAQWIYDFSFPKSEGKPNPHLWTDPLLARRYAEVISATLQRRDPANASYYADNYTKFAARVDAFDTAIRSAFATIPESNRKLLTYHDAYAYFGRDYGWNIIGAIQVSDFEDPTPKEVADLIAQVKKEGVPAIFGSEVFPSPVLAQIGKEARVNYVDQLRDDDLPGKPGDANHSWLGLMSFDFATITTAMGGDASAIGAVDVANVAPDSASYPQ